MSLRIEKADGERETDPAIIGLVDPPGTTQGGLRLAGGGGGDITEVAKFMHGGIVDRIGKGVGLGHARGLGLDDENLAHRG